MAAKLSRRRATIRTSPGDALLDHGRDVAGRGTGAGDGPCAILAGLAALIVLAGAGYYGHCYWTTGRFLVSTDDATVDAHSVVISPKVAGYLGEVAVTDNQTVRAGQILARIEDPDYRTALAGAEANVASARAAIQHLEQQIEQQELQMVAARPPSRPIRRR